MGKQDQVNDWRKSTASANGETCVECATASGGVAIRDTTDRGGVTLTLSAAAWARFLTAVR